MKAIIIIRGLNIPDYEILRDDLTRQMKERDWDIPLFANLPAMFDMPAEIEVVWLDELMEKEKFVEILKQNRDLLNG